MQSSNKMNKKHNLIFYNRHIPSIIMIIINLFDNKCSISKQNLYLNKFIAFFKFE